MKFLVADVWDRCLKIRLLKKVEMKIGSNILMERNKYFSVFYLEM